MRVCRLSQQEAKAMTVPDSLSSATESSHNFMSSANVLAMQLVASNAVQKWQDLLGPENPEEARCAPVNITPMLNENLWDALIQQICVSCNNDRVIFGSFAYLFLVHSAAVNISPTLNECLWDALIQ